MHRVIPFVVRVRTEFQSGSGTIVTDTADPGWFLLTAAHVLHGCQSPTCRSSTCFVRHGRVLFFDEVRSVPDQDGIPRTATLGSEIVEMEFEIDSSASSVRMYSSPARSQDQIGAPTMDCMDVIAVR